MTKLYFDKYELGAKVEPSLQVTVGYLKTAINRVYNFDIPYDFTCKNSLRNFDNDLEKIKDSLEKIQEFIIDSNKKYEDNINECIQNINTIETITINKRQPLR